MGNYPLAQGCAEVAGGRTYSNPLRIRHLTAWPAGTSHGRFGAGLAGYQAERAGNSELIWVRRLKGFGLVLDLVFLRSDAESLYLVYERRSFHPTQAPRGFCLVASMGA